MLATMPGKSDRYEKQKQDTSDDISRRNRTAKTAIQCIVTIVIASDNSSRSVLAIIIPRMQPSGSCMTIGWHPGWSSVSSYFIWDPLRMPIRMIVEELYYFYLYLICLCKGSF